MPNHVTNILSIEGNNKSKIQECITLLSNKGKNYKEYEYDNKKNKEVEVIDFNAIVPMPKCLDIRCNVGMETLANTLYSIYTKELINSRYSKIKCKKEKFRLFTVDLLRHQKFPNAVFSVENPVEQQIIEKCNISQDDLRTAIKYLKNKYKTNYCTWYDWRIDHWGTKWNAYHSHKSGNVITFDTAWSSPIKLIDELSNQYKELTFELKYMDEDIHGENFDEVIFEGGGYYSIGADRKELCTEIYGEDITEEMFEEEKEEEETEENSYNN